jgi:hypothetical protein
MRTTPNSSCPDSRSASGTCGCRIVSAPGEGGSAWESVVHKVGEWWRLLRHRGFRYMCSAALVTLNALGLSTLQSLAAFRSGAGLESRHLETRPKAEARLDLDVSAGWVSPSSRGLCGGDALLLLGTRRGRHVWATPHLEFSATRISIPTHSHEPSYSRRSSKAGYPPSPLASSVTSHPSRCGAVRSPGAGASVQARGGAPTLTWLASQSTLTPSRVKRYRGLWPLDRSKRATEGVSVAHPYHDGSHRHEHPLHDHAKEVERFWHPGFWGTHRRYRRCTSQRSGFCAACGPCARQSRRCRAGRASAGFGASRT